MNILIDDDMFMLAHIDPFTQNASDQDISRLAEMFRLMGDSSRLRIILCCLHEPISVSDIAQLLGLSQSLVSNHLRLLRGARIVRAERRGKQVFYVAADAHIQCVIEDMVAHVGEPDGAGGQH